MDSLISPSELLAIIMAEQKMTLTRLCERSGLEKAEAIAFLCRCHPMTINMAEKLGKATHSSGFWIVREALWLLHSDEVQDH